MANSDCAQELEALTVKFIGIELVGIVTVLVNVFMEPELRLKT
jgi:hypothetical protein